MKHRKTKRYILFILFGFVVFLSPFKCLAQDNYEIQVYESKLVPVGSTMVELHSNYTLQGLHDTIQGVLPTHHALHETVEITHGFTPWMEVGFYQFTTRNDGMAPAYVGNHIRPRFAVPEKLNWPVGLSLSLEFGYQDPRYSSDSWTLEIRPIIDKTWGKLYVSFNPAVDYSFAGYNHAAGAIFAPNLKFSWAFSKKVQVGLEYYNSMGPFNSFDELNHQPHQLALAFDLDLSPVWEINIGYVRGLTPYVEEDIIKLILGRRFDRKKRPSE
ncbi:MAG TPA: hypothetical protein VNZ86_00380 [Bacteroidia bacterium]|jgi:hypothetical protein|nr:hypothetical protein [Bacteroidia bacterium]